MPGIPANSSLRERFTHVRADIGGAGLDALLVSHVPNVRYLTGFAATAGSLVVTATRARLVVDSRYVTAAQERAASSAGLFDVAVAERSTDETVAAILRELGDVRIGIEAASMSVARFNRLSAALAVPQSIGGATGSRSLVPTERIVEGARIIKDHDEIATLREAAQRLSRVAREVARFVTPGRTEHQISAHVDAAMRRAGFERPAFETIVASGPHSALPHARPTGRVVEPGDGVVLDFGGVYDGYCVDLTRTLQTGPRAGETARLFAAVVEAHAAAVAAVRPGARASEIDAAARAVLERHGLGAAFGHGTGHGLGLEVHEGPLLTRAGTHPDTVVEPGMVFTIEPGAYVPGVGGARVEDDVLVVDAGAEILTDVPIDL